MHFTTNLLKFENASLSQLIEYYYMNKPGRKDSSTIVMEINQTNIFYNYVIGSGIASVDLFKTGQRLLESGISSTIFFSDFKCLYRDESERIQFESLQPSGRHWDSCWEVNFSEEMPRLVAGQLTEACQIAFHEKRSQNSSINYLRAKLPPVVLQNDDYELPLRASAKIYDDGIVILSFQLDATWNAIDENWFIENITNIFKCYFKSVWVSATLQKYDAKLILPDAFEDIFAIGGNAINSRQINRAKKKLRRESEELLEKELGDNGKIFSVDSETWELHKLAGTTTESVAESTLEQCRAIYTSNINSLLVSTNKIDKRTAIQFYWQGRPSVSLLRFNNQPGTKQQLYRHFSDSIHKILMRSGDFNAQDELPKDLRCFEDYSFHANRAVLLWIWLKLKSSPENVWEDPETAARIYENQARAEQIEYYNMLLSRACYWAHNPINSDYLINAYRTLAMSDQLIHHSSSAGEISAALANVLKTSGTLSLISASKESARFYLDEQKHQTDLSRRKVDKWLTFVFGCVGTASLADFVVHPLVKTTWSSLSSSETPIVALGISVGALFILVALITLTNALLERFN